MWFQNTKPNTLKIKSYKSPERALRGAKYLDLLILKNIYIYTVIVLNWEQGKKDINVYITSMIDSIIKYWFSKINCCFSRMEHKEHLFGVAFLSKTHVHLSTAAYCWHCWSSATVGEAGVLLVETHADVETTWKVHTETLSRASTTTVIRPQISIFSSRRV